MDCCCAPKFLTLDIKYPGSRCGSTTQLRGSLYETISFLPKSKCIQMFLGNPISYNCIDITLEDKKRTLDYCVNNDTTFYIHCPFIANLAKQDCIKSLKVLSKELDTISGLPAACVLHVGKVGTIENVSQRINEIQLNGHLPSSNHFRVPFHLLLECAAGQGTELGKSWEEIRHLYEALDHTTVGLCIDTQHIYASGMCKLETHEDVVKLFDIADSITSKGISMIHLNDSVKDFGSRVDRHAPLKQGYIWSRNDEGLKALIKMSKDYGMDLISETPDPIGDIAIIEQYMSKY